VQVDPIEPTLRAPEIKRLKLKMIGLLSKFAFDFNLRRYMEAVQAAQSQHDGAREAQTQAHHKALKEMKTGFKAVLQDVVDRVAGQLDAMRRTEFGRTGQYASGAELTALAERVTAQEREGEARDAASAHRAAEQQQALSVGLPHGSPTGIFCSLKRPC